MIETTTTSRITCDTCGKVIAVGETWYQAYEVVSSGVFEGQVADLTIVSERIAQLCETDYKARTSAIATAATTAEAQLAAAPLSPL